MSSFGLVVIADVASEADAKHIVEQVETVLTEVDPTQADNLDSLTVPDGPGVRVTVSVPGAVTDGNEEQLFTGLAAGRAVLCVDGDEYGITVSAWELTGATPRCVYLNHLNDPDIDDDGEDAGVAGRLRVGTQPIRDLATLYEVDPGPLQALEDDPTPMTDNLGFIGTPFIPWLTALNLTWLDF